MNKSEERYAKTLSHKQKLILVVDDDTSVLDGLREFLQEEGFRVRTAGSGDHALGLFKVELPDLVVLDIQLEWGTFKSGWECFERLTALNPTVPIIIITGRSDQVPFARAAGAGAIMEKPFDYSLFKNTVDKLINENAEKTLKRIAGHLSDTRVGKKHRTVFTPNQKKMLYENRLS